MKKIYSIISAVVLTASVLSAQSDARFNVNTAEQAPSFGTGNSNPTPQTPWQVLFQHDITAQGAGVGHAACVLHGTELWTARWANDTIRTFSLAGTLLQTFTIPGLTGVRSFTTDGTNIYAGANTANIYKIDPVGHTVIQTISVPSVPNVRYCTYDPTANSNAGGFWVGTWTTDFTQVSMTGAQTGQLIAASSHLLTATYGLAYDNTSPGGPYVWAFHQTMANQAADIIQVKVSTELQTAVMHNVLNDMGTTTDLAGGLHVRSSPLSLLGTLQGAANLIFAYDITGVSSTPENPNQTDFIGVYPNPTSSMVNVQVNRTNNAQMQIELIDVVGNIIYTSPNVGINNYFDMSQYQAGIYFVKVTYDGQTFIKKIVRN